MGIVVYLENKKMSTIPWQPTQKGKNGNYGLKMNSSVKSEIWGCSGRNMSIS
jgi:hypothetical protein